MSRSQAIEGDEAGASTEDAVEAGSQFAPAPCGGGGAMRCRSVNVQPVHEPFRMHPTQRVLADVELTRVVADNHHVAQQTVGLDAAPQRPFSGDADWIQCDLHGPDVEAVEMRLPGCLIGEPCLLMGGQLRNDGPRQDASAHIVQRRFVDDIVRVPGAQQACHRT